MDEEAVCSYANGRTPSTVARGLVDSLHILIAALCRSRCVTQLEHALVSVRREECAVPCGGGLPTVIGHAVRLQRTVCNTSPYVAPIATRSGTFTATAAWCQLLLCGLTQPALAQLDHDLLLSKNVHRHSTDICRQASAWMSPSALHPNVKYSTAVLPLARCTA